jgi:hypothetical protein
MNINGPQEHPIVEKIAQKKFKYDKIFEEQAMELRKDLASCERAYERVSESMNAVKPGQQWIPQPADKEAYMEQMDNICNREPMSFDE